jgi:hypothetical protein
MDVAFRLQSGSCLVHFHCLNITVSGIDSYTHQKVFESLRVYLIDELSIMDILFIVLWDIVHAAFLQLLACK